MLILEAKFDGSSSYFSFTELKPSAVKVGSSWGQAAWPHLGGARGGRLLQSVGDGGGGRRRPPGSASHVLLATSQDAMYLKKRGFKMSVDEVVGNGPGRYCSITPTTRGHLRMPCIARNESSRCVAMTWRGTAWWCKCCAVNMATLVSYSATLSLPRVCVGNIRSRLRGVSGTTTG
jgi:hypothetical protein